MTLLMEKLRVIQGETVAEVMRLANEMSLTKDEYVQLVVNKGNVVLIYYR